MSCTKSFVDKYIMKYSLLKRFKAPLNKTFFSYLEYPEELHPMIYSINLIERLIRDYKLVLIIQLARPSPESVIALMEVVTTEKESTSYAYSV